MEQAEIEEAVGELETRIDRLRSLYDQYFMGLERLEPLVPRKDVERRLTALRKEQIRNSGLRFKFNVLAQRFNTYQTYWLRTARQIENGTYKRDVRRARARFGVDPTNERATEPNRASPRPEKMPEGEKASREPVLEITEEAMAELEDGTAFLEPLDVDVEQDPFAPIASPASVPPAPRERFASTVRLELDEIGDPFEEHDPFPKPAAAPSAPKIRIAQRAGASAAPSPAPPPQDEHRDTERRIPIAPPPRIAGRGATPAVQGSAAPPPPSRGNEPRVVIAKRASIPDELERASSARPAAPPAPQSTPSLQRAAPPAPQSTPSLQRAAPVRPASTPSIASARAPAVPAAPGSVPRIQARPVTPARAAPAIPSAAPPAPSAPAIPAAPPRQATPVVASRPLLATPSRAPAPAAPSRAPAPAPAPPPKVGDLSGDRFGQIYAKYVETRRERNEPTGAITREALAKQLSESTERLKQKHGGKPIDFEVVVKDGKTILRPVVK